MPLTTGQVLQNRYRIAKLIGQGGFGAVYRAWDINLNGPCALKENLDTSPEAQKQFQLEASLLSRLRHLNLPRVTDHFFLPGQGQYLAMDYVEGENLDSLLQKRGRPFDEAELLPWIEQVCDALEYLHGRTPPIIHRDLKPQNIIITPDGTAMLVDFGISKLYDPQKATSTGGRGATPGYSPPEQYGQGRTDARSDVYGLGATLYTLLTGDSPPDAIERLLQQSSLTPPRQLNQAISPDVETAVFQAIDLQPTNRFATVSAFRAALRQMDSASMPVIQPSPTPPQPIAQTQQPVQPVLSEQLAVLLPSPPQPVQHTPQANAGKTAVSAMSAPKPTKSNPAGIEWVVIPAGEFLYGEKKQSVVSLAFKIGKYPVTNIQYKLFLDANPQYTIPRDWDESTRTYPSGKANHPVIYVSWYDAQAFCHWANCRLPSEQEWEKAARGTEGYIFPWGNDWNSFNKCNTKETHNSGTTPVDYFPGGASPFGVWDLFGNVWEWTSTEVLRGGSWDDEFVVCHKRKTLRIYYIVPSSRYYNIGFRCVQDYT